jgi:hypothetical protein
VTKQVDLATKKSAWIAAIVAVGAAALAGGLVWLLKQRLDKTFATMEEAKNTGTKADLEKGDVDADAGACLPTAPMLPAIQSICLNPSPS